MTPIVIAVSMRDGDEYARSRGWRQYVTVTPRSTWAARGRTGPVFATPLALAHGDYETMLADAAPCAQTVDRERVA